MEDCKELTTEQIRAIRIGINLGRTLQEDYSEIAVIYGYYPQNTILEMLNISSRYGVSDKIAKEAIGCTIRGHEGSLGIRAYEGLILDEERKKIGREHNKLSGCDVGCEMYEKGIGIHRRTSEQKSEDGREGGKIGGRRIRDEEIGIFGKTAEQKKEDSREGVIARGNIPWDDEEKEFAYQLSLKGYTNKLIVFELNRECHEGNDIRTANAVSKILSKRKKSLEKVVE